MNVTPELRRKLERISRDPVARTIVSLFINAVLLYAWIQDIPRRWVLWQAGKQ